jgi:hypothetical protein
MEIQKGNFNEVVTPTSDWVMGFNEGAAIRSEELGLKYSKFKKGDDKLAPFQNQVSKTLTVLISGKLVVAFPDTGERVVMEKEGDYIFVPPLVPHTREVLEDTFCFSIRWPALDKDQTTIA